RRAPAAHRRRRDAGGRRATSRFRGRRRDAARSVGAGRPTRHSTRADAPQPRVAYTGNFLEAFAVYFRNRHGPSRTAARRRSTQERLMRIRTVRLIGAMALLAATGLSAQARQTQPPAAGVLAHNLSVTIRYTGRGVIDATHPVLVF